MREGEGKNENQNKHNRMKKNVGQQSYKVGSYLCHTSLVNIRLADGIIITILSAKGAEKEGAFQSIISPVKVRDPLGGRVMEHI